MKRKSELFIITIVALFIINNYHYVSRTNSKSKEEYRLSITNVSFQKSFFKNYHWMFNNNVMQYSSYIFLNQESRSVSIKGLISVNWDSLSDEEFSSSDFFCSIMSIKTSKYIEIPATDIIHLIHRKPKIIECNFDKLDLINIDDISVAIIRYDDFDNSISSSISSKKRRVLPYFMVNYQIPSIKKVPNEKINNIAICVQFTYNLSPFIYDWVKIHEKLEVKQIVIYDSIINDSLTKYIENNNLNKIVEVRPYFFYENKTCSLKRLHWYKNNEFNNFDDVVYKDICFSFANNVKFDLNNFDSRLIHEDLSANDCYLTERNKFEFVALYDYDEFIFPRRFDSNEYLKDINSCNDPKICSKDLYTSSLYEYIIKLHAHNTNDNISNLSSIYFDAGLYLHLDYNIYNFVFKLFDNIKEKNLLNETINLSLDNKTDHQILINQIDIEYVEELVKKWNINLCLSKKFDSKKNINIYPVLSRFIYLILEVKENIQRPFKCVHYTNNVITIYTHERFHYAGNTHEIIANIDSGHFLSHFRQDSTEHIQRNINSSITKLRIDFEYMNFLIKNFTNYCG